MTPTVTEFRPMAEPIEFRSEGTRVVATGVAMKYGARSKPIHHESRGVFREEFRSGAFAKSIKEQDVESHLEHHGPFLGRTGSGTLRLIDERTELSFELDLPNTTAGRDAAELLERRDVQGSSVGFKAVPKEVAWTRGEDGLALRSVGAARLVVIDLTTRPAYTASTAELALRSLADDLGVEVRSLLEAPDLAALIDPEPGGEEHRDDVDDRETPIVRAPLASLYL